MKDRKGGNPDGRRCVEELGGAEVGKAVIKICMWRRNLILIKRGKR